MKRMITKKRGMQKRGWLFNRAKKSVLTIHIVEECEKKGIDMSEAGIQFLLAHHLDVLQECKSDDELFALLSSTI